MAQKRITINGKDIFQPEKDLSWDFETTYTEDSVRPQSGKAKVKSMFTVESYGYSAKDIPVSEVSKILKMIVGKNFTLYCFSPYFGKWQERTFYIGKGSMKLGSLKNGYETYSEMSFNMVGVDPINV